MHAAAATVTAFARAAQLRMQRLPPWPAVIAMGMVCALPAQGEELVQGPVAAEAASEAVSAVAPLAGAAGPSRPQLAVSATPVPSLAAADAAQPRVRIDITGWSRGPEQSGLGLSMGSSTRPSPGAGYAFVPLSPRGGAVADLDVALRWRSQPLSGNRRVDLAAFRRSVPDAADLARSGEANEPVYGARVEMQFASARSRRLVPELGAIGMQLDGGAKISLRAKRGKPMLYYRASF